MTHRDCGNHAIICREETVLYPTHNPTDAGAPQISVNPTEKTDPSLPTPVMSWARLCHASWAAAARASDWSASEVISSDWPASEVTSVATRAPGSLQRCGTVGNRSWGRGHVAPVCCGLREVSSQLVRKGVEIRARFLREDDVTLENTQKSREQRTHSSLGGRRTRTRTGTTRSVRVR